MIGQATGPVVRVCSNTRTGSDSDFKKTTEYRILNLGRPQITSHQTFS